MKSISKLFNALSTISCIVAIILVYVFIFIIESYYFNGYIILIFLSLTSFNPISLVLSCNLFIQLDKFGLNI